MIDNTNGTISNVAGAIIGSGSTSDEGTFAIITFKAIGGGISYLNLTDVIVGDVNGSAVPVVINNGSVEVTTKPWDVNGDGVVNILDMIIIGQRIGVCTGDENWDARADVNNDGCINVLDMIIVGQHFGEDP